MASLPNAFTLFSHSLDPKLFFHLPWKKKGAVETKTTVRKPSPPLRGNCFQKKGKKRKKLSFGKIKDVGDRC